MKKGRGCETERGPQVADEWLVGGQIPPPPLALDSNKKLDWLAGEGKRRTEGMGGMCLPNLGLVPVPVLSRPDYLRE